MKEVLPGQIVELDGLVVTEGVVLTVRVAELEFTPGLELHMLVILQR